ncbi:hypothetical protein HMPREF9336_03005 [Segniliparus rugosus ATCC BAA-974]|uniref:Bile acid:sodium symporter n=1 Tax=Segniliparus rugosus (strain ATCC BAA-974 / DSM 45345 / CCUG 50838 / CIP 108380 / JCM 13579 / CDC 945) TaxID=679197 RepID=E5XU33_SEGRC|nr:hypothetical protein HMPREF9336_03005 [Segniliparus rugosus ATCC BAA-974]
MLTELVPAQVRSAGGGVRAAAPMIGAVALGSCAGTLAPSFGAALGGASDAAILLLVGLLFFELSFDGLPAARGSRAILVALGMNFLVVPLFAAGLVTALLPQGDARLGVLIYCLFPCTDWFLGFTRVAGGDTRLGAALIPINMIAQLALFPVYLALFAGVKVGAVLAEAAPTLMTWFVLPAGFGALARLLVGAALPERAAARLSESAGRLIPWAISGVILSLFAGNASEIFARPAMFGAVLGTVFVFFVVVYWLGEAAARLARLSPAEHVLLTMTTSARNAPLMLTLTSLVLPARPLVSAGLVLGMLVEFPHLTAVCQLVSARRRAARRR